MTRARPPRSTRPAARSQRIDADILHLDRELVVVAKPAGVLTVAYGDQDDRDTLRVWVSRAIRKRLHQHVPPVRVVQRLDKETSGVLVFARTRRAERDLQQQLRRHGPGLERRYLALALGIVASKRHETVLVPDRGDGLRGSFRGPRHRIPPSGRVAITHVECLQTFEVPAELRTGGPLHVSLVACRLETGRQHQIRIHLAEAGHPVVGEKVYVRDYRGSAVHGYVGKRGRALLHAETLGFLHPADGLPRRFICPPPPDFATLLEALERPQRAGRGLPEADDRPSRDAAPAKAHLEKRGSRPRS